MDHYFFSGALTDAIINYLAGMPNYTPIDVLVSQLDRSAITKMFEFQDKGLVDKLFVDSGAFSFHTGKAVLDLEEYIEYLNSIDDRIYLCAQVDTIPGQFGKPKSKEDYIESADLSWKNYLYMRSKLKSPRKLTPVFHCGESFDALKRILDYRDENGDPIWWIGLSPANDSGQPIKDRYLKECYDFIARSSNPGVHTHLYGMTSIKGMSKVPCSSADSISHRLIAAYNKIKVPQFGVISITRKSRTTRGADSSSFEDTADPVSVKKVADYLAFLGTTFEECRQDSNLRSAVNMYTIRQELKDNPYHPTNTRRNKILFGIV